MRYEDYVDLSYKPRKDLVATFLVEPCNYHSAGAVAAESSTGTWTELSTEKDYMLKLGAKVFSMNKNKIKIAYPQELFERGNMPNVLSSVAGNVFGMKEIKNLKLVDIEFKDLENSFSWPRYGVEGIRKLFKVKRPLIGTIVKPKIGLNSIDHSKVAFDAWVGGCDVVKDDENLASQQFNKFSERLKLTLKMKEKAERITGEKKGYLVNVTAESKEMLKRARLAEDLGNEYLMVDIITTGWSALQTLREETKLIIHAHRAGYASFARNEKHGISMKVIAEIARIIGVDQLHVGTVVGKMYESLENVKENISALKEKKKIKEVMPVASGGLNPKDIPRLLEIFGKDVIIQMGGGIHGHRMGTIAGARAARQALDACLSGYSLNEYAKKHKELGIALQQF